MAYIKPQYPLKSGENYIYPPTTADQVIMNDGQRLSGVGVYLDKPDEGENTTVAGINADTLGGIAASEFVLKTDTIENAINAENSNMFNELTYKDFIELEHGIGSFYFTLNAADDPNNKWNWMTWELVTDKFLLGAGNLYEGGVEGGEAEHTLTVDEIPSHLHTLGVGSAGPYMMYYGADQVNSTKNAYGTFVTNSTTDASKMYARNTGGSQSHNNMPPYLSVFMWTRTA